MLEERFTPGQPVQTLWPLADHLGTARVILDGAGLVLSRLVYDSFGNLVNVPAIVRTFTFTGRDYDDASGLKLHTGQERHRRDALNRSVQVIPSLALRAG